MKRCLVILALAAVVIGAFSVSCSILGMDGDDSGGAGADFDATQYYTKTQIDNMFDYLEIPTRRMETPKGLGSGAADYFTGVAFNQVPTADFVVLYLWQNPSMTFNDTDGIFTIYAGGSAIDPQSRTASTTTGGQSFFFEAPPTGDLKFWTSGLSGTGDLSAAFNILPVYFY